MSDAVLVIVGLLATVIGVAALWLLWQLRRHEGKTLANWGGRWRNRIAGLNRVFCERFHGLRHDPIELPKTGGAIVVGNHVSGLDPMLMIAASPRPLRFIIAREEYDRWYLTWIYKLAGCIPVEREGNPRKAFYAARRAIERGEVVAIFPQGRIYHPEEPTRRLKRGAMVLAQMTGAAIHPVRIEGVSGLGHAVRSVIMRSRVRISTYPGLAVTDKTAEECHEYLMTCLLAPNERVEPTTEPR